MRGSRTRVCVVLGNLLIIVALGVGLFPDSRNLLAQVEGEKTQLSSFVDTGSRLNWLFCILKKPNSVGKVYMSRVELSLCVFLDKSVAFHIRQWSNSGLNPTEGRNNACGHVCKRVLWPCVTCWDQTLPKNLLRGKRVNLSGRDVSQICCEMIWTEFWSSWSPWWNETRPQSTWQDKYGWGDFYSV